MKMKLNIEAIELDETTQCRAGMEPKVIKEYAEYMADKECGVILPPIDVFGTEKKCWLGDGWYRVRAAQKLGLAEIEVELHRGGRTEALAFALQANKDQVGQPRTNADKHRAVQIALREYPDKSNREIARMCAVSHGFVDRKNPKTEVATVATQRKTTEKQNTMISTYDGMAGKKFGKLTMKRKTGNDSSGRALWEALCDCGNLITVRASDVRRGQTKCCGCLQKTKSGHRVYKDQPYEPKTERQFSLANGQKKRVVSMLAHVEGACDVLNEIDIPMLLSVCKEEEIKNWMTTIRNAVKRLRKFSNKLKTGGKKK